VVVGAAAVLKLRCHDRFGLADSAAGGMEIRKAGQKGLVVLARAFFALAKAVDSVDQVGVFPGRRIGEPYFWLVPACELLGIEHGALFEASRAGGGGLRGSLGGCVLVRSPERRERRQQREAPQHDPQAGARVFCPHESSATSNSKIRANVPGKSVLTLRLVGIVDL